MRVEQEPEDMERADTGEDTVSKEPASVDDAADKEADSKSAASSTEVDAENPAEGKNDPGEDSDSGFNTLGATAASAAPERLGATAAVETHV
jgi:hypothetical protein